ncbi:hypothetical protein AKJ29_01850 [Aliiroseovarius crassostreae]|uniref:Uncharacterized protein n=1 Tax=Aliiroseovarius crassostreae TaxID=154981 RepID=A0A0P7IV22_9RHOB|nr:hypothetical protein [Aliiroseovarius crassostreae]KPN62913.1 hypothetical protein AKJ29_01850 [Aliiroseovarius crassostreae]
MTPDRSFATGFFLIESAVMKDSESWLEKASREFFESPEWERSEALLADIGSRTDFENILIITDSGPARLADQSSQASDHPDGDLIEITGTLGTTVEQVLNTYAHIAHAIIPDDHTVVPWSAIVDNKGNGVWLE